MSTIRMTFALLMASMALVPGVRAATIVVDSLADGAPANDGACTLREAVIAANNDADSSGCVGVDTYGADVIELPLAGHITLSGADGEELAASGDLDVHDDVTITNTSDGSVTIDGNDIDRVFDILGIGIEVTFNGLTITGGNASPSSDDPRGGGIWMNSDGTLTLNDCVVTGNSVAGSGAFDAWGAGIWSTGNVVLNRTEVIVNDATHSAGESALGGGIFISGAQLVSNDSRIAGNATRSASFVFGAGIYAQAGASIVLNRSEVSGNEALSSAHIATGGGLYAVNTSVSFFNVTISGNNATTNSASTSHQAQSGGARVSLGGSESLLINNSTIAGNTVNAPNGALAFAGGINAGSPGTIEIANSIIADNLANGNDSDCLNGGGYTSLGYNIVKTNCGIVAATGDQFGVDPILGDLADNGGLAMSTGNPKTHALLSGSPAIDAGNPAAATGHPACEPTDARGLSRPIGAACDIGAYEMPPDLIFIDRFEP